MRVTLSALFALALVPLMACNRKSAEDRLQVQKDLEVVCLAQKKYLETKKLLKSVSPKDLALERTRQIQVNVRSSLVQNALSVSEQATGSSRRELLEKVAQEVGAEHWRCPELDLL